MLASSLRLVKESTFSATSTRIGRTAEAGRQPLWKSAGARAPPIPMPKAPRATVRELSGVGINQRCKAAGEIQVDDAATFRDVRNDDPNIMAQKGSDGAYN